MSLQKTTLWVVRSVRGSMVGPCNTETVIKLISSGELTGDEFVCEYPNGAWRVITKEPLFYEAFLKEIEFSKLDPKQQAKMQKQENETVISPKSESSLRTASDVIKEEKTQATNPTQPTEIISSSTQTKSHKTQKSHIKKPTSLILDLSQVSENRRKLILSLIVFTGVVLIAMFFLLQETGLGSNKVHLLVPNTQVVSLSEESRKTYLNNAVAYFQLDTFDNYVEAEKLLIKLIESNPQNSQYRSILCLVYKELWPFAHQDNADFKAVQSLSQSTKSLDPIGIDGTLCEVVKLITNGKHKEARSVVDNILNDEKYAGSPFLYQLKGELFLDDNEYTNAQAYLEKAEQLWGAWLKPKVQIAQALWKQKKNNEAQAKYQNVLKLNPDHKVALIEMGILEYQEYNLLDSAYTRIYTAINKSGQIATRLESQAYFVLAQILSDKKEKDSAIKFAEKAYELNSSNEKIKELLVRLGREKSLKISKYSNSEMMFSGEQYLRNGDYLSAQAEFKAAYAADPANSLAAMKAAKALWSLYLPLDAINYLRKAIAADYENMAAYYLLADYLSQRYDFNEAIKVLNQAIAQNPRSYEILRGFSLVELRRNNSDAAISFAQKANKVYENDIDTVNIIAKANINKADYKESYKYALRAIELDPTHTDSQIIYSQVLSQFQGIESGITYIKELIVRYAYTHEYRLALADILQNEQRYDQAYELYEQVQSLTSGKSKTAFIGSADCLKAMGKMDEALTKYLKAAIIDPFDPEALFKAGILYMETARYKEAIKQFERVSRINPLYPRVNYFLGRAALELGDYGLALKASDEEKKFNPNLADPYILAAEVYTANKQFQKCTNEYQLALKLRPQGPEIYVKLARCYRQTGNLDVAEAMLSVAISKESGYADIYKEYGACFEQRGDKKAAAQSYQKYLSLSPNARDREEITLRIQALGY